jgi:hypothetical protein
LPPLVSGTLGSALSNHIEVARLYHDCADGKKALADAVK